MKQLDNRGAHFYIAMWWAEAMARTDPSFKPMAEGLAANEKKIVAELIDCQAISADLGTF